VSVPEEAVTAAAAVHEQAINDLIGQKRTEKTEAHIARVMLEAAAPLIAAAERERVLEEVRAGAAAGGGILSEAIRYAERERIRQEARECEATYPFRIDLRGGESYWVAIPFEDHAALVGEREAHAAQAAAIAQRDTP